MFKLKSRVSRLLLVVISILMLITPLYAENTSEYLDSFNVIPSSLLEILEPIDVEYTEIEDVTELSNESMTLSEESTPYGSHILSSKIRTHKDGIRITVTNIGTDTVDSVSVAVKTNTGAAPVQSPSYKIPAGATKTFSYEMPMTLCVSEYKVELNFREGSTFKTKKHTAISEVKESSLAAYGWNKGTYSSRQKSVNYHFKEHAHEVSTYNIQDYIDAGRSYRLEVLRDVDKGNYSKYKTTPGKGPIPSTKFKNIKDGRYMLLTNGKAHETLSFGR